MSAHASIGQAKGIRKGLTDIYLPTVESCWDYGIARNAPLLPFIGSLLPYNFLRGTQFDTKIFKLSEILENILTNTKGLFLGSDARNEVILTPTYDSNYLSSLLAETFNFTSYIPGITDDGTISYNALDVDLMSPQNLEIANFLISKRIHIACDNDTDIAMRVSNTWKAGEDSLTQALLGAANVVKNVTEVFRTANALTDLEKSGHAGVPFTQARYSSTKYGQVTLNFSLFTRNNYIRDIYLPLVFLQAMCIPKTSRREEEFKNKLGDMAADTFNTIQDWVNSQTNNQILKVKSEDIKYVAGKVLGYYRAVKPPDTFSVEHSSGLFFMKKAAITDFSWKAEGPCVRMQYDGLFGKIFPSTTIATALDRLLQDIYVKFVSYPDIAYPTRVKCTMVLEELDFVTLKDFIMRDKEKLTGKIQTSIESLTATNVSTSALIAGGIAQSLGVVIPDIKGAGDLLSGGKWVPPGESMSGIPGFL